MQVTVSIEEHAALLALAEHGAVRIRAGSVHLAAYDSLVTAGLAFTTALDESARFYGLTQVGTELMKLAQPRS